ncbi:MAG: transporter substrate-binding domain-containing protein [Gammaproteobacteria bacterium]|nr:transporter substrate-binding domain-containing protein [Gammaproteobacteria bacterium]
MTRPSTATLMRILVASVLLLSLYLLSLYDSTQPPTVKSLQTVPFYSLLTQQERQFITETATIHIGTTPDFPPYDFIRGGRADGYSTDFVRLLFERLGIKIRFVVGESWKDLLQKLCSGEVDLLHAADKSDLGSRCGIYSSPQISDRRLIVTRNYPGGFKVAEDLLGLRYALPRSRSQQDAVRHQYGDHFRYVEVDHIGQAIDAVHSSRADFTISPSIAFRYFLLNSAPDDLKVEGHEMRDDDRDELFLLSRKGLPVLNRILAKAMSTITQSERQMLDEKWFGSNNTVHPLTPHEVQYLKERETIRYCIDPSWMPLDYLDKENQHQGIGRSFIQELETILHQEFTLVPTTSWKISLQYAKERRCDLLSLAQQSAALNEYLSFTSPYIHKNIVIATREDAPYIDNFKVLQNSRIGVLAGSDFTELTPAVFGEIHYIPFDSVKDGLLAVENNEIFGFMDITPVIAYHINHFGLKLRISGDTGNSLALRLGVRDDDPLLLSVLQKGLDTISRLKADSYANAYSNLVTEKRVVDYQLVTRILIFGAVVFLFTLYRSRQVATVNREYKKFIDTISHEYRTPLSSIKTYLDILYMQSRIDNDHYLQFDTEIKRLQNLFAESLEISRLGEPTKPKLRCIHIQDLVEKSLDELAFRYADCPIDYTPPEDRFMVHADPHQLEIALRNVLHNAAQYRSPKTDDSPVTIRLFLHQKLVFLIIENRLQEKMVEDPRRLFHRFVRGSSRGSESGMGLGLHLAARIIAAHGGSITLQQKPTLVFQVQITLHRALCAPEKL